MKKAPSPSLETHARTKAVPIELYKTSTETTPSSETGTEHLIEDLVAEDDLRKRERQKERNAESIRALDAEVEQAFDKLHIKKYLKSVEDFLLTAEEPPQTEELNEQQKKTFLQALQPIRDRLTPSHHEPFQAWIETHPSLALSWTHLSQRAKKAEKALKGLHAQELRESLEKHLIHPEIFKRINALETGLTTLAEPPVMDQEELFSLFLLSIAEERAKHPGFFTRVFGGTTPQKEFTGLATDVVDQKWRSTRDEKGLSPWDISRDKTNRAFDRKGAIKPKYNTSPTPLTETRKQEEAIESIQRTLVGEPGSFIAHRPTVDFKDVKKLRETESEGSFALTAIELLTPMLGNKLLVKGLKLGSAEQNKKGAGSGSFSSTERRIAVADTKDNVRFAHVLAHETGHALRLEETLSLEDAIRFNLALGTSIKREGCVSTYSTHAKGFYKGTINQQASDVFSGRYDVLTTDKLQEMNVDTLAASNLQEEWADILGLSFVSSIADNITPYKTEIARRYSEKFGFDLASAQHIIEEKKREEIANKPSLALPKGLAGAIAFQQFIVQGV